MKIVDGFIATIKNSAPALIELAKDLGEVALDHGAGDDAFKEIPIIGTLISMHKLGNSISAALFEIKLNRFLSEVDDVSNQERIDFLDKHCTDAEAINHLGASTLMVLDKIDHPQLASMLGKAFALMIMEVIDRASFDMYCHVIKNLNSYLIQQMHNLFKIEYSISGDVPAVVFLANLGLFYLEKMPTYVGATEMPSGTYRKTSFGIEFYKNVM
ncbi:hypothetical protein C4J87_3296 [Pseudomonas sp. R1-43-08]|uniref:hypothetical protein n=1 Tax=Pseudomonas sp. R1-43-08 TaxID=1173270 RepID=UPI000F587F9D|nr:hypothetical protein [Pseudomonas sp. R1-43-08]AZF43447.1 hypothetical protein C4J87_3296 [Pseudomonas sp. R1-43-08]